MESRLEREKNFHDQAYSENLRAAVGNYYVATRSCWDYYRDMLKTHGYGRRVLEYGCGAGSYAFILAQHGAAVTGIDISTIAIQQARAAAAQAGLPIEFHEMNAEQLEFADGSFDLICGTGILHHLDLAKAKSR